MRTLVGWRRPAIKSLIWASTASICLSSLPAVAFPRDEQNPGRPRRVEEPKADYGKDGPLIRVALMTDVSSVALASAGKLIIGKSEDDKTLAVEGGQMRVEISKPPARVDDSVPAFGVEVTAVSDSKQAKKITGELRKKFYEPSSIAYDGTAGKHRVLIGRYASRSKAADLVTRLRKAGYSESKIARLPGSQPRFGQTTQTSYSPASPSADAQPQPDKAAAHSLRGILAFEADRLLASSEASIVVTAESGAKRESPARTIPTVRIGNREYRGEIRLVLNPRNSINVINVLPLEEYLRGVVPLELSPTQYPEIEALRAQAVTARSYALATRGRFNKEGFDLRDDTRSQIYGGLTAEHPLTNRAIEETRGLVAVYPGEDGRLVPIEALYTANCGGHTENSEAIFLTKPVPYLRAVECSPESGSVSDHEIRSEAGTASSNGLEAVSSSRDIVLLQTAGFGLPQRVTNQYLRAPASEAELLNWAARLAVLLGHSAPRSSTNGSMKLHDFIGLVASALYGEGGSRLLLPASEVRYLLSGLDDDDVPVDRRADLAVLLKDRILRLPTNVQPDGPVTREYAIEVLARAAYLKARVLNIKTGSKPRPGLYASTALPAEKNRLAIVTPVVTPVGATTRTQAPASPASKNQTEPTRIEVENNVRLFRHVGGESYPVERVHVRGGERVVYHVNASGKVDFADIAATQRTPAELFGNVLQWTERLTPDEVKLRLARSRIAVGEIKDLLPLEYGTSNRVLQLQISGSEGNATIRGHQVRSALGLKESLFAIERERDEMNRITAFVFTGRGWGHGVGLCQMGAYALAKSGYSSLRILQKYYRGVKVQKVY